MGAVFTPDGRVACLTPWQVTPERITARVSYPVRGAP